MMAERLPPLFEFRGGEAGELHPPVVSTSEAYTACTVASDAAASVKCCEWISPLVSWKTPEYRSGSVSGAGEGPDGAWSQALTNSFSEPPARAAGSSG